MEKGLKVISRDSITESAAMAFADSRQIPEQYARADEVQAAGVVVDGDEIYELPVVDMARLRDPELSQMEIARLGSACRHWGFFQLINHGVDEAVVRDMKDNTVQFFGLPLEDNKAVAVRPDGDSGIEGYGHHFRQPSTDKLDWAESLILGTQPLQERNLQLWPTKPSTFRDSLDKYAAEIWNLATRILSSMASDLGVEEETLLAAFRGKRQSVGLHRYPPCRHPEQVVGITPHTDGLGLALLLHVDDTPGLQIRRKEEGGGRGGRWYPVRPMPGAFVVNVGDILEVLTNGVYTSVEHRVVVDAERGRLTVVIFQDACIGGVVKPLPELGEARYKAINKLEYVKGNFGALGQAERFLDTLKI